MLINRERKGNQRKGNQIRKTHILGRLTALVIAISVGILL